MNCPKCKREVEMLKFTTTGVMCRDCHNAEREGTPPVVSSEIVRCVEEALAKLPYVKWDRWTGELGSEDGIAVYGWIARDDSKADFVWMRIDNDGPWMFATSSAQYSADISKRLNFQGSSGHHPCKRVEDFFNVTTCKKPKAPTAVGSGDLLGGIT